MLLREESEGVRVKCTNNAIVRYLMNQENREVELDLMQLFRAILAKAKYIILVAVIFGMCGFAGSKLLLDPVYEAGTKMIVIAQNNPENPEDVSHDRLNSAKSLVDTYAIIVRSRSVLNQIKEELNLQMSYEQLASCISIKSVNKTEVMQVIVHHNDLNLAFAVVQKIEQLAPAAIDMVYGVGSVKITEPSYAIPYPVSPNNKSNAILAAFVGFALSCVAVVVLFLMDNTYKTDVDIQDDLDLPVLGVIPKVECCGKYSRYGYRYGYGYGHSTKKGKYAKEEK